MDYSTTVISKMKEKYPDLEFVVSDITDMKEFENNVKYNKFI
jgi:hypothetical protein